MGRPKTPSNVLELRGAYKKNPNRKPKDEPPAAASGDLGEPPAYFNKTQRECWAEIAAKAHAGTICRADSIALEMAAVLLDQFRLYPLDIPTARIVRLDSILARFGMTPSDRSKVKVPNAPKENPFSAALKSRRKA